MLMDENLPIPEVGRSPESIVDIRGYQTLVPGSEKRGVFCCIKCGALLTEIARTVPNDMKDHPLPCPNPKCRAMLNFNSGVLAAKILQAQQQERMGITPLFHDVPLGGHIVESIQPNGRKLITACPGAAVLRAIVPRK
jgi:hypothetical protein